MTYISIGNYLQNAETPSRKQASELGESARSAQLVVYKEDDDAGNAMLQLLHFPLSKNKNLKFTY
jgi:hypothetical protein